MGCLALLLLAACEPNSVTCPAAGPSQWLCPSGYDCAVPPTLCGPHALVAPCTGDAGAFNKDYTSCAFTAGASSSGRCFEGLCGACTTDLEGCQIAGWNVMTAPAAANLSAVHVVGQADVFAVGDGGALFHYDGSSWIALPSDPIGSGNLKSVWGTDQQLFVVDGSSDVLATDLTGAWATSFTGAATNTLTAISGSAPDNIFAVGLSSTLVHFDGTSWSVMTPPSGPTYSLNGVWVFDDNTAFAVGNQGVVLAYQAGTWSVSRASMAGDQALNAVWGTSATDVYAVGNATPSTTSVAFHFDGMTWSPMVTDQSSQNKALHGLWGRSATDLFAVGQTKTVLLCNGGDCSWNNDNTELPPQTPNLNGIDGLPGGDFFVVGDAGTIWRHSGP